MSAKLDTQFYQVACPVQTVTTKELQEILKRTNGWIVSCGQKRELDHRKLGPGVYELFLKPEGRGICPYCGRD